MCIWHGKNRRAIWKCLLGEMKLNLGDTAEHKLNSLIGF